MSLKDKRIKSEYRSLIDNVVQDFYIPLLHESTSYKRAVGFFSSSALVEISKGIADMAKDGGKIEIVVKKIFKKIKPAIILFRHISENNNKNRWNIGEKRKILWQKKKEIFMKK